MNCCVPPGLEREFDQRRVQEKLAAYQRDGPAQSTKLLIEALLRLGVTDQTLLDIGGGVGAIQHALLEAGARNSLSVDASSAYVATAQQENQRRGYQDRTQHLHADVVAIGNTLAPFDIVTLDRVVCCYPDMPALISISSERAQRLYGVVLPRANWWLQPIRLMINGMSVLRRSPFRFFTHSPAAIQALLATKQFEQVYNVTSGLWLVQVYRKAA